MQARGAIGALPQPRRQRHGQIRHIAIQTQYEEATANFYVENFGLKKVRKLDSERTSGYFLTAGHINLAILRFKNEFHALQDLHHPNLVRLGELFCENGAWFYTMELIDGVSFLPWVRPGGDPADISVSADTLPGMSNKGVMVAPVSPERDYDEGRLQGLMIWQKKRITFLII